MSGAPLASVTAVFDGTGKAQTAPVGPAAYGSTWNVDHMVVSSTSALPTTMNVYRNTINPASILDNTLTGNSDVSETNIDLLTGETLTFIWLGGTPGAIATASMSGTLMTGR